MEAGLENVRDITPDVMYMRARSAAAADSPLFAPFAATQGLTGLGAEPLGGDDWGVEYGQRSPLGGADGPTRWMGATSGGILSRMQGERHAVGSLLSTYSTWLKVRRSYWTSGRYPQGGAATKLLRCKLIWGGEMGAGLSTRL